MFDHHIAQNLLLICKSLSSLSMQFASNDDVWLGIRKYISGPGVEPGTTAVVRCSTTELFRPIFTVHQVRTTTFLPPKSFFFFLICPVVLKKNFESMLFEQSWIPFTEGCVAPSLVEICPVILEKIKNVKSSRKDGLTNGRQAIWQSHLSFQLRLANSSEKFKLQFVNTYHLFFLISSF